MAAVMAKPKTRPLFLQAPGTSACFQEALRLCRRDSEHESGSSDDIITRHRDSKHNDDNSYVNDNNGDHDGSSSNSEDVHHPLELKALHPSFPNATLVQPFLPPSSSEATPEEKHLNHTVTSTNGPPRSCVNRSVSMETISPQAVAAASPTWRSRRHTIGGGNEEGAESGAGPSPLLPLRVQWADEKEKHALTEDIESPRRRHHDRKSSTSSCDSLRPILKQT